MSHTSVLLHESIEGLDIHEGDTFVDGTFGDGGHSLEVLRRFGDKVTLVGIDRDQSAIERAKQNPMFANSKKVFLKQGNFRDVDTILESLAIKEAQKFLFDVGLSSRQIEESGRGFSFKTNEPLLMTFETDSAQSKVTAKEILNFWEEESLFQIIKGFGEERFAKKIAAGIVAARKLKPIETTNDLVEIILKSTPFYYHHGKIHPATRTFQAIRIAVNDELGALSQGLKSAWKILAPGGRIAVISFHSLEDRIVKQYFNELKKNNEGSLITKKPITAGEAEIGENPRARSAKLRIIQKQQINNL